MIKMNTAGKGSKNRVTNMPAQNALTLTMKIPSKALNGILGALVPKNLAVKTALINANGQLNQNAMATAKVKPTVKRMILIRSGVCLCSLVSKIVIINRY